MVHPPDAAEIRKSRLTARVLTGCTLAAVSLLAMAATSPYPAAALVVCVAAACLWELRVLVSERLFWWLVGGVAAGVVAICLAGPWAPWLSLVLCAAGSTVAYWWSEGHRPGLMSILLSGWVSGSLGAALWMQNQSHGEGAFAWNLTFVAVPCLWAGDTLAYIVGKTAGRHKMAPSISPGKTWEGAAAHAVGAMVCAWGFGGLLALPGWIGILCGLIGSVAGQAGDLLQSKLKRAAMVKDSGDILPGHGGVLDRVDSMLLSVPAQLAFLWAVAPWMFHVKR